MKNGWRFYFTDGMTTVYNAEDFAAAARVAMQATKDAWPLRVEAMK